MSKWFVRSAALAAIFQVAVAASADAQVFTPSYLAPRQSSDAGVYLSDGPGEFAVEGIWRRSLGDFDFGFRAGVADTDDLSFMIGADYRNPLPLGGSPLDISITGGAQALLGDASGVGFAAGLTAGHTFAMPGLAFTPYIHPRIGLVDYGVDEFDLELLADFGLDIQASSRLDLRFGFGLDSTSDWGVGFAWR